MPLVRRKRPRRPAVRRAGLAWVQGWAPQVFACSAQGVPGGCRGGTAGTGGGVEADHRLLPRGALEGPGQGHLELEWRVEGWGHPAATHMLALASHQT